MKKNVKLAMKAFMGIFCLVALAGESINATQDANPTLKIGIVQKFGANRQDRLVIRASAGDKLNLSFRANDGKNRQTITTDQVVIEIAAQPLSQPQLEEKVVLSNHRSFENAAASAYRLQQQGIETEIAQPRRWQVWAKRNVYDTSLLRHLLLYSFRSQGHNLVQIDSKVLRDRPLLSWVAGDFRYNRDSLDITSNRGLLEVNQRLYAGTLRLQPNAHQSYTLVNNVPIETYLRGVVPHEIGYGAPYEAVKAQAVLARTYALASLHRFVVDDYQLCADTQCQVYRGLESTSETADRAIAQTKGQVLTYNSRVIDALYSSTTGGVTANYNDLWDGQTRPYLRAVVDSVKSPISLDKFDLSNEKNFRTFITNKREGFNEAGWETFRWKNTSSLEEIKGTLREFLRLSGDTETRFNQIQQIDVVERSPSGRVLKMEVKTDTKKISLEKDEIVDAFYAPNSTLFYLQPIYEASSPSSAQPKQNSPNSKATETKGVLKGYSFIGGGLGHGVGMSQTGSYNLARMGWSYQRILDFYYTGASLQTLKPEFWSTKLTTDDIDTASLQNKTDTEVIVGNRQN